MSADRQEPCPACGALGEPHDSDCEPSRRAAEAPPTAPHALRSAPEHARGDVVGERYELLRLLGSGAHGRVFEARDRRLERAVAVKTLLAGADRERFEREARVLAGLEHPHVVRAHDYGSDAGRAYLVMELVGGSCLSDSLKDGPLPWTEAVRIVAETAAALEHAHAHGIVHRDVKPANILLTEELSVKVSDFGVAKVAGLSALTDTRMVIGTPHYLAPERWSGREADARSDVYSLGVVLYELLTGLRPFDADLPERLIQLTRSGRFEPPSAFVPGLPPALDSLVGRCLAAEPEDRPARARDVELELRRLLRPARGGLGSGRIPGHLALSELRPPPDGDRRTVVLLQVQARHLGELAQSRPPAEVASHRRALLDELGELVGEHGGRVAELGEDRVLSVFGLPAASERDAERAVSAARSLVEVLDGRPIAGACPRLAVALHLATATASVGAERYRLDRDARRMAEALAEQGGDGEIFASSEVVAASRQRGRFETTGADVTAPSGATTGAHLVVEEDGDQRDLAPLIGREQELLLMLDAAQRAREGAGSVLTLEGPAGIGKTRLLREVLRRLPEDRRRFASVLVSLDEASSRRPHEFFRRVHARLSRVIELEALAQGVLSEHDRALLEAQLEDQWEADEVRHLDSAERLERLRDIWLTLLQAAGTEHPIVLAVDDVQWLDRTSRELLGRVVEASGALRVLFLLAHRPEHRPSWAGRHFHVPLVVTPLPAPAEQLLLREALQDAAPSAELRAFVSARAEGNPFYVLELARAATRRTPSGTLELDRADLPASIEAVLRARLDRLPLTARRTLQACALAGRDCDVQLLARVLEEDAEVVEAACGRLKDEDLLMERFGSAGRGLAVHHALIRRAAEAGLVAAAARALHGRWADVLLQGLDGPQEVARHAAELAAHLARSNRPTEALPHFARAVDRAHAAGDLEGALDLVRAALDVAREAGDPHEVGEWRLRESCQLAWCGDPTGGEAEAEAVLLDAEERGDEEQVALAHLAFARCLSFGSGREDVALDQLRSAADLAERLADPKLRAEALASQVELLLPQGRTAEAETVLDELEALQDRKGSPEQRLELLKLRAHVAYDRGRTEEALRFVEEGLTASRAAGDRLRRLRFLSFACTLSSALGRPDDALRWGGECLEEAREIGQADTEAHVLSTLAEVHRQRAELEEAEGLAARAAELALRMGWASRRAAALHALASVRLDRGHLLEAGRAVAALGDVVREPSVRRWRAELELDRARHALALGRLDEASAACADALDSARELGDAFRELGARRLECSLGRLRGKEEAGAAVAEELETLGRRCAEPESLAPALVAAARALLACAAGSTRRSLELAEEAAAVAKDAGLRLECLWARLARAEALAAGGEPSVAAREAADVATEAESVGADELAVAARVAEGEAWSLARHPSDARRALCAAWLRTERTARALPPEDAEIFLMRPDRAALRARVEGP